MQTSPDPDDRVREFLEVCSDDGRFGAWYDDAAPRVYRFLHARTGGDVALAEEITQAAMVAAIRARATYDGRATAVTWVCSIARNLLIDHHRRLDRDERRHLRVAVHEIAVNDVAGVQAERDAVRQALRQLPAIQRLALVLRYIDDEPVSEIARLIGRSEAATHALLTRSRERFRTTLQAQR